MVTFDTRSGTQINSVERSVVRHAMKDETQALVGVQFFRPADHSHLAVGFGFVTHHRLTTAPDLGFHSAVIPNREIYSPD